MRILGVYIYILISFMLKLIVGDVCIFDDREGTSVQYDQQQYECIDLQKSTNDVTRKSLMKKGCGQKCVEMDCLGLVCADKCIPPKEIPTKFCMGTARTTDSDRDNETGRNHIPLIIGFAVGGVMLAVVIAGVLLGRANRGLSQNESSVVTTPVSMSYSEWISNYSTGGWGAKHLSTRVQESGSLSDIEHPQGLAVYSIEYGEEDAIPAKKYKFIDEPTVIEVDEMGGYDNQNRTSFYQTQDDVLRCVAAPTCDDQKSFVLDWPQDLYFYDDGSNAKKDESIHNDSESFLSMPWRNSQQLDKDTWSASESLRRGSATTNSLYSKRRDTWSDESNCDTFHRYSFPGRIAGNTDSLPSRNTWIRVPKQLSVNFSNLKHVFVDVHRSMSYSHEDGRAGFWAFSDGSGTFDEGIHSDIEKTSSYITIKNNCIYYGSGTMPRLPDELFLYPLQYNQRYPPRRSSI